MWILILMTWNACLTYSPATSIASVPGFATLADCDAAGRRAVVALSQAKVQHVCVGQPR